MAEAVGIVAASGQFIEQSAKIYKVTKRLLDQLRDGPVEIEAWRTELQQLESLITQVKTSPSLQVGDLEPTICQCNLVSIKLRDIFDQINFNMAVSLVHKTWKAVGGLARESEIRDLFGQIERLKSTLNGKIAVVGMHQNQENFAAMNLQLRNLKDAFQSGTPEDQCVRGLFVTDPVSDRDGIMTTKGQRTKGTCEWITKTEQYVRWEAAQSDLLWISGPPGKGKTFISIYLTQHLELAGADNSTVIWFFCDNKNASRNTSVNLLRGLITQLIQQHSHLISYMMPAWTVQRNGLFGDNSFEPLWRIFTSMLGALREIRVCCVLDALDECYEESLKPLLVKLGALYDSDSQIDNVRRQSPSSIKLIVASREQPSCLPSALSKFTRIRVEAEKSKDLSLYISHRVASLSSSKGIEGSNLSRHVQRIFEERAEGTFLWVSLMALDLEQKPTHEIEDALQQLPHGLDAVYMRIISQIRPADKIPLQSLLTWLLFARRPLSIPELCGAVDIRPTQQLPREEVCLGYIKSCGHLLQLIPEKYKEGSRVTFLHQSVKDFLHDHLATTKDASAWGFTISDEKTAHAMIATRLIAYLSILRPNPSVEEAAKAPLMLYAVENWSYHMSQLGNSGLAIVKANKSFFGKDPTFRQQWYEWKTRIPITIELRRHHQSLPVLHMGCMTGLPCVVKHALRKRQTMIGLRRRKKLKQIWGSLSETPLSIAVWNGNLDVVALLLKLGDDINDKNTPHDPGLSLLHKALRRQSEAIFNVLASLSAGDAIIRAEAEQSHRERIDVDATLLHLAARFQGGVTFAGKLIEEHHYNINVKQRAGWTPLTDALEWGNLGFAKQLVDWGAELTPSYMVLTAALRSSYSHADNLHDALALVTGDFGIDINSTDEEGNTFFHIGQTTWSPATWRGKRLTTQLREAITFGFDLDRRNPHGKTILHREGLVDLNFEYEYLHLILKESQLAIDARDNLGQTPLISQIKWLSEQEYSVTSLRIKWRENLLGFLDFGADRWLKDVEGWTAVDLALKFQKTQSEKRPDDEIMVWGIQYKGELWSQVTDILANYSTVPIDAQKVAWVEKVELE